MKYQIAAITHPGTGEDNQDNFFCNGIFKKSHEEPECEVKILSYCKDRNIFAVFDGIGGLYDGGSAALTACEALYDTSWVNGADIGAALLEADKNIMTASVRSGRQMGSTCVIVEEKAGRFRSWNVGDSRAYYYSEGRLLQISRDHTEAENARTIQGITGEPFHIPDKYEHTLTQYLGADKSLYSAEPFASEWMNMGEGCMILLCSDGLYDFVDNETTISILREEKSALNKCRDLIEAAITNNSIDDITVVLIEDEHK